MIICYTDQHTVDEDLTAISIYGGRWNMGIDVGITRRSLNDLPVTYADTVASSNISIFDQILYGSS